MAAPTLTPNSREEQDERYDPSLQARQLENLEQQPYDREFDDIANNYSNSADPAQEDAAININAARDQEQTPATHTSDPNKINFTGGQGANNTKQPFSVRLMKGLRKGGPGLGIGAFLFGGAGLGLFFLSPGLLLVQMKEVFTNYGSSSSRAAIPRYNKMLQYTIGNPKVDTACNKSASSVKCRLGTMSDTQKKAYEKAGFKINGKDYNGRIRVTDVEFPDGHKESTGNGFIRYSKRNIAAASAAKKAHNPATKVYNGVRFAVNVLKNKYRQNRDNVKVTGDTDEEKKANFNTQTGEDKSDSEREKEFKDKYENRIDESGRPKSKFGRLAAAVQAGCGGYNIAKVGLAAVKVENSIRYVGFALQFLKVADQIKNNGDVDPETVAFLGGVLTSTALTGEKAGLAAPDSQGYKTAATGGEGALKRFTQRLLLGGNPALIRLDNTIKGLQDRLGRSSIRTACRGVNDPGLAVLMFAVVCGGQILGDAAAGTIIPVAGNAAGALIGLAQCVLGQVLFAVFLDQIISYMVGQALPRLIDMLAATNLDVHKISGVDAGNAMAIGASVMLGTTALSRGLMAGTKSQVTKFLAATAEDQAQADQIAMYDAKNEPFNIYNQYSFLGSTLRKTGIALRAPTSLGEGISNLGTIVRSSFGSFTTARADPNSMPVNITDADLSACPDRDMTDLGIACDRMGNPQFVLSPEELAMDVGENLDYMIDKGFVNEEEGTPVGGTTYDKWVANCTENRETPMGATMMAIEEEDYYWGTGDNCVSAKEEGHASEEDLSNFRVYYNTLGDKEDSDYTPPEGSGDLIAGEGSLRVATFNIFHIDSDQTEEFWKGRLTRSMDVMARNNIDIAGFQEVRKGQLDALQRPEFSQFTGGDGSPIIYETYPKTFDRSPNPIVWNSKKYSMVGDPKSITIKYDGGNLKIPVLRMKDATGAEFYIVNTHDPADSRGTAQDRLDNANTYVREFAELAKDNIPIVFTGDFNSSYTAGSANKPVDGKRENLTYCVFTRSGDFIDASDAFLNETEKSMPGSCPRDKAADGKNRPDHIFVSSGLAVTKYFIEKSGKLDGNGSDVHDTVIIDVGIGGAGTAGDFQWPVDKKYWDNGKSDFLDAHTLASHTFTSPSVSGVASDISSPPKGSPVYAMLGGTVVKTNLCGEGDGMIIQSKIQEGTVLIAYGHGTSPQYKVGDQVGAGKQILSLGEVGCKVWGAHLHVDMTFNGKHVCPQDVFLAMGTGNAPSLAALTSKATGTCERL